MKPYNGSHLQVSKFHEQDSNKTDLAALKQRTLRELSKFGETEETGVFLPGESDRDSGLSIEEKENISK